jgi:hypothetical protein
MSHSKLACSYNLQQYNFEFVCTLPEIVYQSAHTEKQVLKTTYKIYHIDSKESLPILLITQILSITGHNCN